MENKLLNDQVVAQVQAVFTELKQPVQVLFFGSSQTACDYCEDTLQLLKEVSSLSDKLGLSEYDLDVDTDMAQKYRVEKAPAFVLAGKDGDHLTDYGVQFSGIPAGHEFGSLIHDLVLVSSRDSGLDSKTRAFLAGLDKPVHLQVFVTPTCPYCPRAVVLAHQMAMESPMVLAEAVDAAEFPDLADRFHVSGVPQTTINAGAGTVIGAVPEDHLVIEIQRALQATIS